MPQTRDPKVGELVVSETRAGVWSFHLRQVDDYGFRPSGLFEKNALCGQELGWDTLIPLETYGKSHSNNFMDRWCKKCLEIVRSGEVDGIPEAQRILLSCVQIQLRSPTKNKGE